MRRPFTKSFFSVCLLILLAFSALGFRSLAGVDTSLVGYWKLDDGTGTTASDSSGYNHPGNLVGSWSTQHAPANFTNTGSISLTGAGGQGVLISLVAAEVDNITLSAWVKWAGTNSKPQAILYNGDKAANGYGIYLQENGTLAVLAGGAGLATSNDKLTAGTWQNVVAMRDAGTWKLFLDGKQIPLTGNPVPAAPSGQTTIGRTTAANTDVFNGLIDEVRIYTRVLAVAEFAWHVFPLYVVNYEGNNIVKVTSGGVETVLSSGGLFNEPDGMTVAADGFLYIANYRDHKVFKVNPHSGEQTLVSEDQVISFPDGLAFDSSGMLYTTSLFNDRIVRINPADGSQFTVTSEGFLDAPSGLVFDSDGMLWATGYYSDNVVKVDPATGGQTQITAGNLLNGPNALIFDLNGMLYVTSDLNDNIVKIDPATGNQTLLTTGGNLDNPYAMVFYEGDLYVSSMYNHKIVIVDPVSGEQTVFLSGELLNHPTAMVFGPNYEADLALTKTDSPDPVIAGTNLTYTLNLSQLGQDSAYSVTVSDPLPANTTFVSAAADAGWSISSPAVGATGTVTFTKGLVDPGETAAFQIIVKVSAGLASGTTLTNTATVSAANPADPNTQNNSVSTTTTVHTRADLSLTKSDQGSTSTPGGTVIYTLQYANAGPSAAHTVRLVETLPANTTFNAASSTNGWSCTGSTCTLYISTLNSGASGSANFAVTVNNPVPAGLAQLSNTATIESNTTDPAPGNNTAIDTTPVTAAPDLTLIKTEGSAFASQGQTVPYTLSYANAGNQGATGVVLTETVPANTTFNASASTPGWSCSPNNQPGSTCTLSIGSLAGGASGAATFAVTVSASAPSGGKITNTASIADDGSNGADPTPANNSSSVEITVSEFGTATTLVSSANPSLYGQAVTFTATVTSSSGTPVGTVTFKDGQTPIPGCQSVALNAGKAVCTTSTLAVGTHTITAAYTGTSTYGASTGTLSPVQTVKAVYHVFLGIAYR